ncbi:Metallopeptidase family M24 [Streptomyces sp. 2323.1]|uniref:M24 family metallopeptidase n=1 Tax=Streptomyces sp. 2323.1 TaxID=1938841 RepID=UPI000BB698CD|nr:M24 family metallopeptidase [Streptomyces sp. 2323.1]SOE10460.1 Metallopeptidase family M24 [Streptomyces sp. 2323.1]
MDETVVPADIDEEVRALNLIEAERKAVALFDEVTERGIVAPGQRESEVSNQVRDLAADLFGTSKHWHKRIVRSGPNTLHPYRGNPPDRLIAAGDIVFLDFGPVFSEWEADFGRTYVLGDDPEKLRLRDDLPGIWEAGRKYFETHPDITGAELYAHIVSLAEAAGWAFGGPHSGHLVGEFPHELIDDDLVNSYITPSNHRPLRSTDDAGRRCHWILEIHLVDRARTFGGFFEQLLTLSR